VSLTVAIGCGPTMGPEEDSALDSTGHAVATGGRDSSETNGSAGSDDSDDSDDSDSDGGEADTGTGTTTEAPVGSSSTGAPIGDVEMYGACAGDDCVAGLQCTTVAFVKGGAICTAQCSDPARDCDTPPDGGAATCGAFTHMPPDPFCAIACDEETPCPEGMSCGLESPPFSPPFYCVPGQLE